MVPLFFLLSLSIFSISISQANESQNPVVIDINGTMLRQGLKYYVEPLDPDQAGLGFNLFPLVLENRCPKGIFQAAPYYWGCLITFHPINPEKKGVIREWTNLNVEIFFDKYTDPCPEPNFWRIESKCDVTHRCIATGGEPGNLGQETLNNWFKIVKTEVGYKFVYCPSVCDSCRVVCQDVGVSLERLVLSDTPFEFTFRRPETLVSFGKPVPLPNFGNPQDIITLCDCDINRIN